MRSLEIAFSGVKDSLMETVSLLLAGLGAS